MRNYPGGRAVDNYLMYLMHKKVLGHSAGVTPMTDTGLASINLLLHQRSLHLSQEFSEMH